MISSLRCTLTSREIFRGRATILLIALLTGLTACQPPQMVMEDQLQGSSTANRAAQLAGQGDHQAAADAYFDLARTTADPTLQQRYLIQASNERLLAGFPEIAKNILDRVRKPINESNALLWTLVAAEVETANGFPEQALNILSGAPPTDNQRAMLKILKLRANALFRLGDPLTATSVMIERETWLENRTDILSNQQWLWESYQTWGSSLSEAPRQADNDPVMTGWLQLGGIAWGYSSDPLVLRRQLRSWQSVYFNHPANDLLIPEILSQLPRNINYPNQIAVLLPLSGRQEQAAKAIRDGLLAGYFQSANEGNQPRLRIYDVTLASAPETYDQAIADGADFVIGPLLKENVQALAQRGVSTPTLTLNFLPDDFQQSVGFYQFSLSPEDEARQVARRAAALGQYRALALAPNNAWGKRLMQSFNAELISLGGQVLDYRFYEPKNPDYSTGIQSLLLIDESQARHDRLSANLGIPLEFESRRRSDIDLIFMAATASSGKLIRPQLRFHFAGSIPTYSTSAIYQEGSRNNSDLNGIMFPDMPWNISPDGLSTELRKTLTQYWPDQAERRARLYAMGFDAYRLVPFIYNGTSANFEGMTGSLHFDYRNRVHRELPWAKIRRGRPELMDPLPEAESEAFSGEQGISTVWPDTMTPEDSAKVSPDSF